MPLTPCYQPCSVTPVLAIGGLAANQVPNPGVGIAPFCESGGQSESFIGGIGGINDGTSPQYGGLEGEMDHDIALLNQGLGQGTWEDIDWGQSSQGPERE